MKYFYHAFRVDYQSRDPLLQPLAILAALLGGFDSLQLYSVRSQQLAECDYCPLFLKDSVHVANAFSEDYPLYAFNSRSNISKLTINLLPAPVKILNTRLCAK